MSLKGAQQMSMSQKIMFDKKHFISRKLWKIALKSSFFYTYNDVERHITANDLKMPLPGQMITSILTSRNYIACY